MGAPSGFLLLATAVCVAISGGAFNQSESTTLPFKVKHYLNKEASGEFTHVAGSACCHVSADSSLTLDVDSCERRCWRQTDCEAFIFSPSNQQCFLVRFTLRDESGTVIKAATPQMQAASDRVFGLVRGKLGVVSVASTDLTFPRRPLLSETPAASGSLSLATNLVAIVFAGLSAVAGLLLLRRGGRERVRKSPTENLEKQHESDVFQLYRNQPEEPLSSSRVGSDVIAVDDVVALEVTSTPAVEGVQPQQLVTEIHCVSLGVMTPGFPSSSVGPSNSTSPCLMSNENVTTHGPDHVLRGKGSAQSMSMRLRTPSSALPDQYLRARGIVPEVLAEAGG